MRRNLLPLDTLVEGHAGVDGELLVEGEGLTSEDDLCGCLEESLLGLDAVLGGLAGGRVFVDETLVATYEVFGHCGVKLAGLVLLGCDGDVEVLGLVGVIYGDVVTSGICCVSLYGAHEVLDDVILLAGDVGVDGNDDETGGYGHNENKCAL